MNKRATILICMPFLLASSSLEAKEAEKSPTPSAAKAESKQDKRIADKNKKQACDHEVQVSVKGLVCDFCARALEKVFNKRDEVSSIKVDLDKDLITIEMRPGKSLDDQTLSKLIIDSGYNVAHIKKGC